MPSAKEFRKSRTAKRRKRILLILGVAAVLSAGGVGAYYVRRASLDKKAQEQRDAARAALAEGKNEEALDGMGQYLQRLGWKEGTAADYIDYAKAREAVPLPNNQNLVQAMGALQKGLQKDPTSREAQDRLLTIYMRTGRATEALDLADLMLATTPDELRVLRAKADVLEALRRMPEALPIARVIAARKDSDHGDLVRALRLLIRTGVTPGEVDAWINATSAARPGEQFVELMRASVLSLRGDTAGANRILDKILASSSPADDPRSLSFLVQALDEAGRFSDGLRLLTRLEETSDPGLRRDIVRRVWFAGQAEDALARAERWDGDRDSADPEILAIHALALTALGRGAEAEPIVQQLASRDDPVSAAWAALVKSGSAGPGASAENLTALTKAAAAVPDNGLILCALGNANASVGEWDAAILAWTTAAQRAPAWAIPFCGLARAYRAMHRPDQEIQAAAAAFRRAPTTLEAVRVWIEANGNNAGNFTNEQLAEFLKHLAQAQASEPRIADVALPVRVALTVRTDKAAAAALLQSAVDAPKGYSEATLLRLAATASSAGIPLDVPLLRASESVHGVTPRLAVAHAIVRARAEQPNEALGVFDEFRAKAPAGDGDREWSFARASLLDAFGRSDAAAAWIALADANPADLSSQLGALASPSFMADRDAAARVVERVKGLTGDGGVTWRLSRAQSLLDAPTSSLKDVTEASEILGSIVKDAPQNSTARVRLAQALEKLGDLKGADEQLQSASGLAPNNTWIALELARIAQLRGRTDDARQKLDRVLATKTLAPEQSQRAAFLLAAEGELGRSAELLQQLMKDSRADRDGTLLLAKIFAKQGRIDDAIRLCESVIDRPTGPAVELTAALYATAGRTADADAMLARLDTLGLPPGDLELIRARHASRWGPANAAQDWYLKAIAAAPGRPDAWVARLTAALTVGDQAAVVSVLDDPRAADVEQVRFLQSVRDLCDAVATEVGFRAMLLGAMSDKPSRPAVTEALRVMVRDWSDRSKREQVARSVLDLANANVGVLALQLAAADLCAQTGGVRTACDLMQRTTGAFPNSAFAARRNAELLFASLRLTDALEAGRVWKDRAERQDLGPDEFIARVLLRLGRPSDAAAGLDDYIKSALVRPAENENLLLTYCVALVRSGRAERAGELMRSLAERSDRWRTLPLVVSADWMGSSDDCIAWLGLCAARVPASEMKVRMQLAQWWVGAATKFPTPELIAGAKSVLAEITASPDAPVEAFFLAGSLAQSTGDLPAARTAYEGALRIKDDFHAARNNLAMVCADSGQSDDAIAHATQVVKAYPRSTEALDTLAYALRKGKKYDEARARLQEAIALEPANLRWRVGLAETIAEQGDVNALTAVLAQIRKMEEAGTPVTPELRARIDKFRPKRG